MPFDYPTVRKENLVETIHGIQIADPYRWMENSDSKETQEYIRIQQNLTELYLKDAPNREDIRRTLKKMWNYEKVITK